MAWNLINYHPNPVHAHEAYKFVCKYKWVLLAFHQLRSPLPYINY